MSMKHIILINSLAFQASVRLQQMTQVVRTTSGVARLRHRTQEHAALSIHAMLNS